VQRLDITKYPPVVTLRLVGQRPSGYHRVGRRIKLLSSQSASSLIYNAYARSRRWAPTLGLRRDASCHRQRVTEQQLRWGSQGTPNPQLSDSNHRRVSVVTPPCLSIYL
jgi:hypothetical protein